MEKFMKKLEGKYFHLQIKLLFSAFLVLFFLFTAFQLCSEFLQKFFQNIIYLHVPAAWGSIIVYIYIFRICMIYNQNNKTLLYGGVFFVGTTIVSGILWEKLIFGKCLLLDIKLISYYMLLLSLVSLFFLKNFSKILALVAGLIFYIQSYLASDWINTVHQKTYPVVAPEFSESFELINVLNTVLLFLQTFALVNLILFLNRCFIKPTTIT